jgi:hypothetical protein
MTKKDPDDLVKTRGLGLKQSEWGDIDKIAADLDWKQHAVVVYAVRYFLKQYHAGKIKTVTKTTKELPEL